MQQVVPSPDKTKTFLQVREPVGVAAIITPWNFPFAMIARKVAAALASGCTCIIKPSPDTPLSAIAFANLALRIGVPHGVINVITTDANLDSVSRTICESPAVRALSFTGSTRKVLYEQCSQTIKKISLELGGNAAFVVFDSADVESAVRGLMAAKFRNAGQACISPNRIFVQSGIYATFVATLRDKMSQSLFLGDGMSQEVNTGPLINERQVGRVESLVEDAKENGAKALLGGKRAAMSSRLFYEPTLLTDVTPHMQIYKEEIFGPVVPVIKFETEE
ncbi:Succinate-semialdehyde dehydrogenase, partial [Caligus rogercresseyi]